MTKYLSILYLLLFSLGCNNKQKQNCDTEIISDLVFSQEAISHKLSVTSNFVFNNTLKSDTFQISIFLPSKDKLAFHISNKNFEYFYNSKKLTFLDHNEKSRSIEDIDTIEDLIDRSVWSKNILSTLDSINNHKCKVANLDNQPVQIIEYSHKSKSKGDSTKIVEKFYLYKMPRKEIINIEHTEITIRETDTLLIQKYEFYEFHNSPKENLDQLIQKLENNQYEIESDDGLPFGTEPIKEGERLTQLEYVDIEGEIISMVGEKYSLLIFSYLGCAPCEKAFADLSRNPFASESNLNIYYCNFIDDKELIKKNIDQKEYLKNSFGPESNMISNFRLPTAPTFVLINLEGIVIKIIEGYDETVFNELDSIIKSR